jgi:hypothetical protein
MYWPAEPYLSPVAAEVSSRGWPPRAVAARARSSYAVTSAVELSGVVTFDIKGVVATPALEGASGVSEERRPRRANSSVGRYCLGVAWAAEAHAYNSASNSADKLATSASGSTEPMKSSSRGGITTGVAPPMLREAPGTSNAYKTPSNEVSSLVPVPAGGSSTGRGARREGRGASAMAALGGCDRRLWKGCTTWLAPMAALGCLVISMSMLCFFWAARSAAAPNLSFARRMRRRLRTTYMAHPIAQATFATPARIRAIISKVGDDGKAPSSVRSAAAESPTFGSDCGSTS